MSSKQELHEPRVGIFWLFDGKLIIDSTPISNAEPYGDNLGHLTSHSDYWEELQCEGVVPQGIEYEEPPRGRVGYNKREERFWLRADKCILGRKAIVRRILIALNITPDRVSESRDDHYRCTRCLERAYKHER